VPAATLYLHIDQIDGVGGPWTLYIGGLGGDFGIANEDVRMFEGGVLVIVSFAHFTLVTGARGP
jgi:hypothetical protein